MVLMKARHNGSDWQQRFSEKRKVLKDSAFVLTREVAKEPKWQAKQIKDRQAVLAKLAVQTWSMS